MIKLVDYCVERLKEFPVTANEKCVIAAYKEIYSNPAICKDEVSLIYVLKNIEKYKDYEVLSNRVQDGAVHIVAAKPVSNLQEFLDKYKEKFSINCRFIKICGDNVTCKEHSYKELRELGDSYLRLHIVMPCVETSNNLESISAVWFVANKSPADTIAYVPVK